MKQKKKLCFIASSGGHFEQLLMLKPLMERYDSFIVTEKTKYALEVKGQKIFYLHQVNRKEVLFPLWMLLNSFKSLFVFITKRPDIVVSTGVLATIPMCLLAKIFRKKLIYIESFAVQHSPTLTGKFLYRFADRFYVQWESMLQYYPDAIFLGGIY